jgi:hypothetical protein
MQITLIQWSLREEIMSIVLLSLLLACYGKEYNPGTDSKPFRTIQKAADVMNPSDACVVASGTYRETVRPARSGEQDKPICFRAAPDSEVIIDGTEAIAGQWELHDGNIYKTGVSKPFEQLFAHDKMMIEARWPNIRFSQLLQRTGWAESDESSHGRMIDSRLAETDVDWTGALATLNIAHQFWTWTRYVSEHDKGSDIFTYSKNLPGLTGWVNRSKWGRKAYFLSGILEALDAPGEWYLDSEAKTLFLWPIDGKKPTDNSIRYKNRVYGFDVRKRDYIHIQGIQFFGCTFRFLDCDHCIIEDCHLLFPTYSRELTELAAERKATPSTLVQGDYNTVRGCSLAYSSTHGLVVNGSQNLIEENLIHDVCWNGSLHYVGIKASPRAGREQSEYIGGNTVRRNTVYNGGNALVSVGGQPDNVVEFNHIHHGGMACKDVSLLYTQLPTIEGTVFRYNWVHDCHTPHIALGIRGDDQTRGLTLHHNVVWNCGWEGIIVKGDRNSVLNNTCFDNGSGENAPISEADMLVFVTPEPKKPWRKQWPLLEEQNVNSKVMNNAVVKMIGNRRPDVRCGGTLANNYVGDMKSVLMDADNLDFRPKPDSPLVDGGRPISGITDGFAGKAPDIGAYESEVEPWNPGITWEESKLKQHYEQIKRSSW